MSQACFIKLNMIGQILIFKNDQFGLFVKWLNNTSWVI